MGLVQGYAGLVVARVFLGVAEVRISVKKTIVNDGNIDKRERLVFFPQLRIF